MKRNLRSVGKEKFVTYFYQFRDLGRKELENLLISENASSNLGGARWRIGGAKNIFSVNLQTLALQDVIKSKSKQVSYETKERARIILDSL